MVPDRLKKIIDLLIVKTNEKKTNWNKTSGQSQFKLSISEGSAITISEWNDNFNNESFEVTVFNSNGDPIERFSTDYEGVTSEEFSLLKSFHKAASDSYYKVEETMDALLASILDQDIIGNKEQSIPPVDISAPDDDDLPF